MTSIESDHEVRAIGFGDSSDPEGLGEQVAERLLADGAGVHPRRRARVRRAAPRPRLNQRDNGSKMAPMTPVSIVGAGPGDPSLISVRGLRYLSRADVIVHDALIDPRLLRMARPDAERIDVGDAAPAEAAQDAICLLVAEKAREGKSVVRLKWGDPFVFDSGGKEALFLHEQGILFEVVPGIPALVGIPAYAGIPVTYPGSGNTLTFIRGYEDGEEATPDLDWHQLAKVDGTLLCYAGPRQLARVAASLLAHGRPADDSAAIISRGTTPQQRTTAGTLESLVAAARCASAAGAGRARGRAHRQACASTCAGSTSGRCSARASS